MKQQFMKMGGCKTEQEFYNKFPNEATFFEAFPAARRMVPMAQAGLSIPPDFEDPNANMTFGQVYQGLKDKHYAGPNSEDPEGFVNPDLGLAKRLKEMGYSDRKIIQVLKGQRESVLPGAIPARESMEAMTSIGAGTLANTPIDITPDMVIRPSKKDYNKMKFNDAFREARLAGDSTFTWHGKKYGTQLKGEHQSSYTNDMPDMRHRTFQYGGSKIDNIERNLIGENTADEGAYQYNQLPDKDKIEVLKYLKGYVNREPVIGKITDRKIQELQNVLKYGYTFKPIGTDKDTTIKKKYGGSAQPIDPYKSYADPRDRINDISQWMYRDGGGFCADCAEDGGGVLNHMKKGGWIQDATKNMRTDKPCTGAKFGSSTCPPGSKRYNLAKTFRAMAHKAMGGATQQFGEDEVGQKRLGQVMNFIQSNNMRAAADEEAQQMYFQQGGNPYGYKPNAMIGAYDQAIDNFSNPNALNNFAQASGNLGRNSWMETNTTGTMGMAANGMNVGRPYTYPIYQQQQSYDYFPANYQNVVHTDVHSGNVPDWSKQHINKMDYHTDVKNNWLSGRPRKIHSQGTIYFDPITGEQKSTAGDASQSSVNPTQREEEITGNIPTGGTKGSDPNFHMHDLNQRGFNSGPNRGYGVGKSTFDMNKSQPSGYQSNANPFLNSSQNVAPNMNYGMQNPKNELQGQASSFNPWQSPTPAFDGAYPFTDNAPYNTQGVGSVRTGQYRLGGVHEMSHKELMDFMAAGGQVEFID